MNYAPDWPKQSHKLVTGIFSDLLDQSGTQFIDYVPPEIALDISLLRKVPMNISTKAFIKLSINDMLMEAFAQYINEDIYKINQ